MKIFAFTLFLTVIFVDILAQERIDDVNNSRYAEPASNEQTILKNEWDDRTGVRLGVDLSEQPRSLKRLNPLLTSFVSSVKNCYSKDMDLYNKCLFDYWKKMAPLRRDGIPELNIPQLDPILLPKLVFAQKGSLVEGEAVATDIVITGMSNFVPKKLTVNIGAKTIALELFFPRLTARSNYVVNGVMMLLPVKGNGSILIDAHGVDVKIVCRGELDGGTKIRVAKLQVEYDFQNGTILLSNLYGGKGVTEVINKLINDNLEEIHSDVKHIIKSGAEEAITCFVSGMVKSLPIEYVLPPEGMKQLFASGTT